VRAAPVCVRLADVKAALRGESCAPLHEDAVDWTNWPAPRRRLVALSLLTLAIAERSTLARDHGDAKTWFAVSLRAHAALQACGSDVAKIKVLLRAAPLVLPATAVGAVGLWPHMYARACAKEALAGKVNASVLDPLNSQFTPATATAMFSVLAACGELSAVAHRSRFVAETSQWEFT